MSTTHETRVEQLAVFMATRDARLYGGVTEPGGPYRPTWEERGPAGQEAYLADAEAYVTAIEIIDRTSPKENHQ